MLGKLLYLNSTKELKCGELLVSHSMNSVEYWSHLSKTGEKEVIFEHHPPAKGSHGSQASGGWELNGGEDVDCGARLNFGPNLVLGRQCWSRFPGPTARSHAQDGHSTCHPDWVRHFCQALPSNHVIVHSAHPRYFAGSSGPACQKLPGKSGCGGR